MGRSAKVSEVEGGLRLMVSSRKSFTKASATAKVTLSKVSGKVRLLMEVFTGRKG